MHLLAYVIEKMHESILGHRWHLCIIFVRLLYAILHSWYDIQNRHLLGTGHALNKHESWMILATDENNFDDLLDDLNNTKHDSASTA